MSRGSKASGDAAPSSSRVICVVFVLLLLDLLAFTLILPLLPSILDHYAFSGDAAYQSLQSAVDVFREALGIPMEKKYNSVLFGGLIGSAFSLLQFLSSPITGALSDRYGRRPLLLLTTVGMMGAYALWALSRSFAVFLLFRAMGGVCKGNVGLCAAAVADMADPKARNRGMAMIGVAFSLGFTAGPLMGAWLAAKSASGQVFFQTPALLALAFSAADLLFIWLMLPETLLPSAKVSPLCDVRVSAAPCGTPTPMPTRVGRRAQKKGLRVGRDGDLSNGLFLQLASRRSQSGLGDLRDLLSPPALFNFSAVTRTEDPPSEERMERLRASGRVYFCYLFLFSGLEFTLSFLTHQRFHFTSMQQGKMFFFVGVAMASIQGGYARRIKPGHHVRAVRTAIAALIPAFLLIGLSWNVTMLYAGLALYSFAAAVVVPCLSTLVSEHGSASQKGTVMGILRSLGALARALGPVVSSTVYWLAGAQICFLVTSACFVIPLILLRGA